MPTRSTRSTSKEPTGRRGGAVASRRPITWGTAAVTAVLALTSCATLSNGNGRDNVIEDVSTTITGEPVELTLAYTDDLPSTELVEGFTWFGVWRPGPSRPGGNTLTRLGTVKDREKPVGVFSVRPHTRGGVR